MQEIHYRIINARHYENNLLPQPYYTAIRTVIITLSSILLMNDQRTCSDYSYYI